MRKQLEHLRRELDSATVTKERQLQSLRQQEEAAAKKGDYTAAADGAEANRVDEQRRPSAGSDRAA